MAKKKSTEAGGKPAGKPAAPSAGLSELIGRALTDKQFRVQLHTDQEAAVRGYNLSKGDLKTLKSLDPEILEAHANSLGAEKSALKIMVKITKKF
jgi:hypothetical protein